MPMANTTLTLLAQNGLLRCQTVIADASTRDRDCSAFRSLTLSWRPRARVRAWHFIDHASLETVLDLASLRGWADANACQFVLLALHREGGTGLKNRRAPRV